MRRLLLLLSIVLVSIASQAQGIVERYVTGLESVETGQSFIYRTFNVPVLNITYHEFSADQVTWRKNYVNGDCYMRFTNEIDNSASRHPSASWYTLNICTGTVSGLDTIYVDYGGGVVDTLTSANFTVKINLPDTITGSTINFQDSLTHTHALQIYINDNQDVNASPSDGQVLKYNSITGQWEAGNDLVLSGEAGGLRVTEEDNLPSVSGVTEIRIPNAHLVNNGNGSVSLVLSSEVVSGENTYWRTGVDAVTTSGTHSVTFSSALPDNNYVVANAYAIFNDSTRQNLNYGNLTAGGFDVYGVIDSCRIHYLAIYDIDSLLAVQAEIGKVLAAPSDPVYGYLSNKVDDTTIVVQNYQLHVVTGDLVDLVTGLEFSSVPQIVGGAATMTITAGYQIPTTASATTWDAGYNDKINSVSVTGVNTHTLTLTQQDGGTVTTTFNVVGGYGEMYEHENTALTTIGTTNVYHAVDHFMTGLLSGFTFVSGIEGSGSVTDYGGTVAGTVKLTDVAHGLLTGDVITVHMSTDYNGTFTVTKIDDDNFYFTDTYVSNQTADWAMGSYLRCDTGYDGVYKVSMSNTSFAAFANKLFKFGINKNATALDNIAVSRQYGGTDYGSLSASGFVSLVAGDRIWLSVKNQTDATDITIRHANVNITRP